MEGRTVSPLELRMRDLLSQIVESRNPDEAQTLAAELRGLIHQHVEELRANVTALPVLP